MATRPDPEMEELAIFLQGCLAGAVMKAQADGAFPINLRPGNPIDIDLDPQGTYRDHFFVVTASGRRLKVRVTPDA